MTARETGVLQYVRAQDGTLVTEMAKKFFCTFALSTAKQYAWQTLKSLEAKGKVFRTRVTHESGALMDVWKAVPFG